MEAALIQVSFPKVDSKQKIKMTTRNTIEKSGLRKTLDY